jgi:hypothetical protein
MRATADGHGATTRVGVPNTTGWVVLVLKVIVVATKGADTVVVPQQGARTGQGTAWVNGRRPQQEVISLFFFCGVSFCWGVQ